jgi:hypothetical protein
MRVSIASQGLFYGGMNGFPRAILSKSPPIMNEYSLSVEKRLTNINCLLACIRTFSLIQE